MVKILWQRTSLFWLNLFLMTFLFSVATQAQQFEVTPAEDTSVIINYIPKYSWSGGIEYSFLPAQISDGSWVPDNYEIQVWLGNRWYLQVGAFAQYGAASFDNYFFNYGFGLYAGVSMKLFMFNRVYFTPSWNVYYDQTPKNYDVPGWSITTGPTASFEYYPIDHISIRIDLLNYNFGYFHATDGDNSSSNFIAHRGLGVGLRYNFDLRK